MQNIKIEILATWFGLGRLKPASGTWGTLGAIPMVLLFRLLGDIGYLVATALMVAVSVWVSELYQRGRPQDDPSEVVIDEVAGFCVAMAWLPSTWQAWAAGFLLFRVLDALKPPPIRWLDQKIKGGIGIVADDIAAGVIANACLQFVFERTDWLGYQWGL